MTATYLAANSRYMLAQRRRTGLRRVAPQRLTPCGRMHAMTSAHGLPPRPHNTALQSRYPRPRGPTQHNTGKAVVKSPYTLVQRTAARHDRRAVCGNTLFQVGVATRWEPHVGHRPLRDPALNLLARKRSHGILLPAVVHQNATIHTWMGSCQSTPAQRCPPMRLSPSTIPLAVVTTPKPTDAGTVGSMTKTRRHKVIAHMQASPRCHQQIQPERARDGVT